MESPPILDFRTIATERPSEQAPKGKNDQAIRISGGNAESRLEMGRPRGEKRLDVP